MVMHTPCLCHSTWHWGNDLMPPNYRAAPGGLDENRRLLAHSFRLTHSLLCILPWCWDFSGDSSMWVEFTWIGTGDGVHRKEDSPTMPQDPYSLLPMECACLEEWRNGNMIPVRGAKGVRCWSPFSFSSLFRDICGQPVHPLPEATA